MAYHYHCQYQYQLVAMQGEHLRKGPWLQEEDEQLTTFVTRLGERRWDSLAKIAGLRRSGKSCRLRWMNYLRPNLKHGPFSAEEEQLFLQLQQQWGNKWSKIARRFPGRTDNDIKNYWRTHLRKKAQVQQDGTMCYSSSDELQYKLENSAQDHVFYPKSIDTVSKDYFSHGKLYSRESELETKDGSLDAFPISEWGLISSPYETRISDWMAELQNGSGKIEKEQEQECDTRDYSGSLWDGT